MTDEALIKKAFEEAAIGIALVAIEPLGKYLEVNPTFCRMTGYRRKELLARDFQSITATPDLHKNIELIQPLLKGVTTFLTIEKRYIRKDGRSFWARLCISLIRDRNKNPLSLLVQIEDIEKRRGMEKALRESETRYRKLVEFSPEGIFVRCEGRFVYVNSAGAELLGARNPAELIGKPVKRFIHPDYYEIAKERIRKINEEGVEVPFIEAKFLRLDGTAVDVEVAGTPFQYDGKPAVQVITRNISRRKAAESKLRRQAAAFHELHVINTSPGLDEQTLYDKVVTGVASLFEMPIVSVDLSSGTEVVIVSIWQKGKLKHGMRLPISDTPCGVVIRKECSVQFHGSLKKKFPRVPFFAHVPLKFYVGTPIFDSQGEVVGAICLMDDQPRTFSPDDIEIIQLFGQVVGAFRERKNLEETLQHIHKLEAVGQLAGGIAHEFNNLLTIIIGYLQLALAKTPPDSPIQLYLGRIEQGADRAAKLTQQILAFSRRSPIKRQPNDLNEIVSEVIGLLRQTIDRRIQIVVKSAKNLQPVLVDKDTISQVVMNLLVNARDALMDHLSQHSEKADLGDWEPHIRIKIENVRLDKTFCRTHPGAEVGDFVGISIHDNGSGIDKAVRARIFEPFFSTKGVGRGTGLGLSTAYGIVKQHDGWIGLGKTPGRGVTFEIYLPCTKGPLLPVSGKEGEKPTVRGTETILLVDDEPSIRQLGRTILKKRGYSVLLANDGAKALKTFKKEQRRIALVILDLTMPRQSGWEVLRKLRQLDPSIRVIIASGHRSPDNLLSQGDLAIDLIAKPYYPEKLALKVREVLDRKRV